MHIPDAVQIAREGVSLFLGLFLFLDRHVLQFAGLENVPTFLAFHIFGFFVAGDDLHPWMLALLAANFVWGGLRRLARHHNLPTIHLSRGDVRFVPNWRYFAAAR